tara:strand:+ start:1273 stop:2481 length:1209 start_codon:yes stop_codon:yes gene_type:complete
MANRKVMEAKARLERLQGYVQVDPNNIPLLTDVGDLQHELGELVAAEKTYERVLEIQAGHEVVTGRLASVYISQHRFGDAEAAIIGLNQTFLDSPELHHNLGIALVHQGKWEAGLNALQAAAEGGVSVSENLCYQSYCLINLSRRDEALLCAESALDIANDEFATGRIAMLQMELGQMAQACETAEKVLRSNPQNVDANVIISSRQLETQDVDKAERHIQVVLRQDPNNHRALLNKALVQMYNQKFPQAIKTLERTLELTPRVVGTWVTLGWAHIANNDLAQSEATFRKTIEVDRNFGEAHGGLASVLAMQSKTEEAQREIALARGLNKNSFGAAFAMSLLLEQSGKEALATRILTNMFKQSPAEGGMTIIDALNKYMRREAAKQNQGKPPQNRGPVKRTLH